MKPRLRNTVTGEMIHIIHNMWQYLDYIYYIKSITAGTVVSTIFIEIMNEEQANQILDAEFENQNTVRALTRNDL